MSRHQYAEWAEKNLDVELRSGAEYMVRCVFHDNTGSAAAQFNVDKGLYVCFSCGEGGGMKKLTRHLGLRFTEPEFDVNDLIGKLNRLRDTNDQEPQLTIMPEDTLDRYRFPTYYWGPCKADPHPPADCSGTYGCVFHRWLKPETVDLFDLGYDPLENAAIIPVRNYQGGLVGVIRRFLDEDVDFRYKYPKGFQRSKNIFASWLWEFEEADTLVMDEGAVDAMCVWQAGFMSGAQYGSSISATQIRLLKRSGIVRVVLFYDKDKAGQKATEQALGKRVRLRGGKQIEDYDPTTDLSRHFLIERVQYPRYSGEKDPGSMSPKRIRKMVNRAVPLI